MNVTLYAALKAKAIEHARRADVDLSEREAMGLLNDLWPTIEAATDNSTASPIYGCPTCGAPENEVCTTPGGRPRNDHKRRINRPAAGKPCDECGQPVPAGEEWTQPVEGGAGIARGHRVCVEAEWGPAEPTRTPTTVLTTTSERSDDGEPITKRDVARRFFVANFLDGRESGLVRINGHDLADAVADLFSSDEWDDALLAAVKRLCHERPTNEPPTNYGRQ